MRPLSSLPHNTVFVVGQSKGGPVTPRPPVGVVEILVSPPETVLTAQRCGESADQHPLSFAAWNHWPTMVPAAPHCMASTAVCAGFQSERSSIRYTAWAQPSRRRAARRAGGGRRGGGTHRRTRRESRSPRPRSGHRARARRRGSGRRARARARSGSPVRPPAGSYARARLATAETVKLLPPLCLAPVEPPANRARRVGAAEWQCAGSGSARRWPGRS